MSARTIYQGLCEASNLDGAVKALPVTDLTAVAKYLSDLRPTGGVPAQVWGMVSARLSAEAKPNRRAKS